MKFKLKKVKMIKQNHGISLLSIPGITHANQRASISTIRKVVWLLLFTLGLTLTAIQVTRVVKDYMKYPTNTKMTVIDSASQPLPALTVCTFNKIKCSSFMQEVKKCSESNCLKLELWCNLGLQTGCIMNNNALPENESAELCPEAFAKLNESNDDEFSGFSLMNKVILNDLYSKLEPKERFAIGVSPEGMILSCNVHSIPCHEIFNITTYNTLDYGNCFIFNDNGEVHEVRTNPTHGLTVDFYLARGDFSYNPSNEKEGLRAVVHEPKECPLIEDNGIDILPTTSTGFGLDVTEITRQPNPYPSECVDSWSDTDLMKFASGQGSDSNCSESMNWEPYTMTSCSRSCILLYTMSECGCFWHIYDDMNMKNIFEMKGLKPDRYCSQINQTELDCLREKMESYDKNSCGCKPQCKENLYNMRISTALFPSQVGWLYKALDYDLKFRNHPINFSNIYTGTPDSMEYSTRVSRDIQANMARIQLYFVTSRRTQIKETPVYPGVMDLFTNLGGAISLWMGFSFIMVAEVIELILDFILSNLH